VSASLSTHVLDVERGRPARGVRVELWQDELVTAAETDGDGRIGELASGLEPGVYRLLFPLLVSSYSCTTYRGS